jgi:DNA-binding XRE family transcriptional regulator
LWFLAQSGGPLPRRNSVANGAERAQREVGNPSIDKMRLHISARRLRRPEISWPPFVGMDWWRRSQNRILNWAMSNIVSGRQIRAARMLAGLTQADLARAAGCHPRSVRYWEGKGNNPPTNVVSTLDSIEQALIGYGVILFSTPTPGVRLL